MKAKCDSDPDSPVTASTEHPVAADANAAWRIRLAWLLLWLMPGMFAANHIVARLAPGHIEPHALALGRWVIAALILLPFAWKQLARNRAALGREWPDLLLLGILGMWFCGAFVYVGARSTVAVNIGLLFAAVPVAIVLLSWLVYREKVARSQVLGIALCLAGLLAILARGDWARLEAVRFGVGDIWVGVAASSWALYTVLLKHRPSVLDQTARLTAIMVGGIVALLPATAWEALRYGLPDAEPRTFLLVLVVALLPGIGAYWSFSFVLRELGAARTAIQMYAGPIYSAVLAWLVLGEEIAWYHLLGAALILPGIWLATRAPK